MSHFVVLVRVSNEAVGDLGGLREAVAATLAPYQENMGDCPEQFLVFNDNEDEFRKEYEEGSSSRVRLEDGSLVWPWDERFRVPGSFGLGSDTHNVPGHLEEVSVPHREVYSSLEEFAEDYRSTKRDQKTGRFGYWENPDAKWDWWEIGGRWTGYFPLKPSATPRMGRPGLMTPTAEGQRGDMVRVSEIDFDQVATQTRERADEFWEKWRRYVESDGKHGGGRDDPRSKAIDIGLLRVAREAPNLCENERSISWKALVKPGDDRSRWHDVCKNISREEFDRDYLGCFCPLNSYARLDNENGWVAKGDMGWFGVSHGTPEQAIEHSSSLMGWISETGDDEWIIAVDCHI